MNTMISCSEVSFKFPGARVDRVIFDEMTASFDAGMFHAVMGPSGSGKTTLLSLLDGSLALNHGTIMLAGRPSNRIHDASYVHACWLGFIKIIDWCPF